MTLPAPPKRKERDSEQLSTQHAAALTNIVRDWILLSIVFLTIVIDQLTKFWVTSNMRFGQSIPSDGFFRLTYTSNTGSIFGLFPNQTLPLTILSIFAIGGLIYFYRTRILPARLKSASVGLLLGGAFGNLIDRVRHATVIDFLDVGPWPIFNIADSAITVGIAIVLIYMLFVTKKKAAEQEKNSIDSGTSSGSS